MPRPRNIKSLTQLAPGSRNVQQFLPVYKGPRGTATTDSSSPAGRVIYKRNYGYFYDVATRSYVTKRQRHNAITGWTSYEQQAQARRTYGPTIESPVVRRRRRLPEPRPVEYVEPTEAPTGDYIIATHVPQEPEPVIQAGPAATEFRQRDIDVVIQEMDEQFTIMYSQKRYAEGASDDEISAELSTLLPELEDGIRYRREVAEDFGVWVFEPIDDNQATRARDALNDWLEAQLGTDAEDFWSQLYPNRP